MMTLETPAGQLTIERATRSDEDATVGILRDAADWLLSRGNSQWRQWNLPVGSWILRERIRVHEVYLFRRGPGAVGTVTIEWSDAETWGERGMDGLAGYIHGLAIARSVGGIGVGDRILEWTAQTIAERGRRFARLDAMASNAALCRYYEQRGFVPLETVSLIGDYVGRLFQRDLRSSDGERRP